MIAPAPVLGIAMRTGDALAIEKISVLEASGAFVKCIRICAKCRDPEWCVGRFETFFRFAGVGVRTPQHRHEEKLDLKVGQKAKQKGTGDDAALLCVCVGMYPGVQHQV